jgi:flagellar secretion chaperone FliS
MFNRSNGIATYGRVASFEADPLKQIVMLYDGAIKFLHAAAADIESGDLESKTYHSNRALDIVDYLQSILDMENGADVARSLDDLYARIRLMVLKASSGLDAAVMRAAAESLRPVRNAWEENSQKQIAVPAVSTFAPAGAAASRI